MIPVVSNDGALAGGFQMDDYECLDCWRDPVNKKVGAEKIIACPWSPKHRVKKKRGR